MTQSNNLEDLNRVMDYAWTKIHKEAAAPWDKSLVDYFYSCVRICESEREGKPFTTHYLNNIVMCFRCLTHYFDLCKNKESTLFSLRSLESYLVGLLSSYNGDHTIYIQTITWLVAEFYAKAKAQEF